MRNLVIALCGATALLAPMAAHAQSNLFSCNKPGNSQGAGAAIGAIIGGIIGNQVASDKNQTLGTILGAGAGAAAGSSIGCNMGADETNRAETATRLALEQNRSQTWSSARSGMSGRVDIVNTFYRNDVSARAPDNYYANSPRTLDQVRFANRVQHPGRYTLIDSSYRASNDVNLRAGPSTRSSALGLLRSGQRFQALARVNSGWLLVGQNGVAVGYVQERSARLETYADNNNGRYGNRGNGYGNNNQYQDNRNNQRVSERQTCRTFDQTVQTSRSGSRTTQRLTACQNSDGDWVIQG